MNREELNKIKENAQEDMDRANAILRGDRDNYDGADGARYIQVMCGTILRLAAELEQYTP